MERPIEPKGRAKKAFSMERVMIFMTLFFILGVVLLVIIPQGAPWRSPLMILYMFAVIAFMYRFGV